MARSNQAWKLFSPLVGSRALRSQSWLKVFMSGPWRNSYVISISGKSVGETGFREVIDLVLLIDFVGDVLG